MEGVARTSAKGSPASRERGSADVKYQWKGDTWRSHTEGREGKGDTGEAHLGRG